MFYTDGVQTRSIVNMFVMDLVFFKFPISKQMTNEEKGEREAERKRVAESKLP